MVTHPPHLQQESLVTSWATYRAARNALGYGDERDGSSDGDEGDDNESAGDGDDDNGGKKSGTTQSRSHTDCKYT